VDENASTHVRFFISASRAAVVRIFGSHTQFGFACPYFSPFGIGCLTQMESKIHIFGVGFLRQLVQKITM
jgi:hypothetical protein